jgi:hypothetical protein
LEHHIGFDGHGYPALPKAAKPHLFSQIVGLADFISWGTVAERFYRRQEPLHRLIRAVVRRAGTQFSPLLVKLSLPLMGFFPPGTHVRLTSGAEAVVIEPDTANPSRPTVGTGHGQNRHLHHLASLAKKPGHAFNDDIIDILDGKGEIDPLAEMLTPPDAAAA